MPAADPCESMQHPVGDLKAHSHQKIDEDHHLLHQTAGGLGEEQEGKLQERNHYVGQGTAYSQWIAKETHSFAYRHAFFIDIQQL